MRASVSSPRRQLLIAFTALMALIAIGTVSFKYLEGWTWNESFYFSVVTLSTVGYGELHPTNDGSRLFAAIYILLGVGIAITALGVMGTSYLQRREERLLARVKRREEKES